MVFDFKDIEHIYLCPGKIDFRQEINGLTATILSTMKLDPFTKSFFVFCSNCKKRIKIIYFDGTGFWLFNKRLERGKFAWPNKRFNAPIEIKEHEFRWFLYGGKSWSPNARKIYLKSILF